MSVFDLASETQEHLEKLLMEIYEIQPEPDGLREAFIYRHARFVNEIGRDMALLYSHEQYAAASIAVRSMLESCFCIGAALKVETFAAERMILEADEAVKRLCFIYKDEPSRGQETIDIYAALIERIKRESPTVDTARKWSVFKIAEAADLEGFYIRYFLHCLATHATAGGMISHEYESTVGTILETAITAMISTSASLAQSLKTKTPQQHIDRCAELLGQLAAFSEQGVFEAMNAERENRKSH